MSTSSGGIRRRLPSSPNAPHPTGPHRTTRISCLPVSTRKAVSATSSGRGSRARPHSAVHRRLRSVQPSADQTRQCHRTGPSPGRRRSVGRNPKPEMTLGLGRRAAFGPARRSWPAWRRAMAKRRDFLETHFYSSKCSSRSCVGFGAKSNTDDEAQKGRRNGPAPCPAPLLFGPCWSIHRPASRRASRRQMQPSAGRRPRPASTIRRLPQGRMFRPSVVRSMQAWAGESWWSVLERARSRTACFVPTASAGRTAST